ncbi:hypothetical protein C5167_021566 [Papaver somniferum]|nr:hypothetical protein C5167_021566 [Papaver somniferum]
MDVHHQISDFNTDVTRLFPPANQGFRVFYFSSSLKNGCRSFHHDGFRFPTIFTDKVFGFEEVRHIRLLAYIYGFLFLYIGTTYYVQEAQFFSRSVYPWFPRYCVAHGFYCLISIGLYYAHLPKCSVGYRGGPFCFSLFSPEEVCEERSHRTSKLVIMHKVRFQEAASMTDNIIGMVINIQLQSITEAANHGGGFGVYHPQMGETESLQHAIVMAGALFWDLPPYLNSRELSLKSLGEETLVQLMELALIWMLSEETLVLDSGASTSKTERLRQAGAAAQAGEERERV